MITPEFPQGASLLAECRFRLDGGAMFGHVPKVVWSRLIAPDEQNRILLGCWPMLLRHPSGRLALIETGMGDKWPAKEAALYGLEVTPWDDLLAAHGVTCGDVTDVILTHLHFDHAGGVTKLDPDGKPVPRFPGAIHHVQRGEWDTAHAPDLRSKPSYRAENFDPVPLERWNFIEGEREIMPGVRAVPSPGHTRHHQSILVECLDAPLVYLGDIVPTSHHLKPHYVMGYDLYPLDVMANRSRLLGEAATRGAICIFEHDGTHPAGRIAPDGKGGFVGVG